MNNLSQTSPFRQLTKYFPLLRELVKRDMKHRYRRSFLGYLWSLLNPLLMMCVMSFVFSTVFKSTIPNFPVYLICGQTLWSFFQESTNTAMHSVVENGPLLKKVYIPKFIFPLSRVVSSFVTMSFSLLAVLIVMVFTGARFYWTILLFWIPLVFLFVFSCGMGLILSALSTYFRDINHLYGVLTLAWMYATPVFYDIALLPERVRGVIRFNPIYHIITFFRGLILYGQIPGWEVWTVCALTSTVMLAVGMLVFKKLQKNFILYI